MSDFLPKAVREELRVAQKQAKRRRATRVVHIGDEAFPILEMEEHGFAVDREDAPRLRGLVDIYDGARHLYQALIVASAEDGDMMRYEFKRNTAAATTAAQDFVLDRDRAIALLSAV